jgi:putative ABC transport system substrate-binding protein
MAAFSLLIFLGLANAEPEQSLPRVAVLYPTVSKQYSSMFDQIIQGVTSVQGYDFVLRRIDDTITHSELREWAARNNIQAYIALGQNTYRLAELLHEELPLIAGGMVATPPGVTGISLTADPEAFFRHLQIINPEIRRVFLIYSKQNNGWLIPHGRQTSKQYGIEFVPLEIENLQQTILQYQTVLRSMQPATDALWIPLDNMAPMDVLLPEILQASWEKRITVFSNNLAHVRRGVLFSLFPDHYLQGRRLVALLRTRLENNNQPAVLLSSVDLKIAVNMRTASHLNLQFSKELQASFDQIYPAYE